MTGDQYINNNASPTHAQKHKGGDSAGANLALAALMTLRDGDGTAAALESLIPIDVAGMAAGQQRYGFFTNDRGGILDDLMLTRHEAGERTEWLLIVNASNKDADTARLTEARYRGGVASSLDNLDAQRSLYTAQRSQVSVALAAIVNRVALYRVLGGDSLAAVTR